MLRNIKLMPTQKRLNAHVIRFKGRMKDTFEQENAQYAVPSEQVREFLMGLSEINRK